MRQFELSTKQSIFYPQSKPTQMICVFYRSFDINIIEQQFVLFFSLMSFFDKLMGKKKAAAPKIIKQNRTNRSVSMNQELKIEAACVKLDHNIDQFNDKENQYEHKYYTFKQKAKECLELNNKRKAKEYLEEANRMHKKSELLAIRKKALILKKFQLEEAAADIRTVTTLEQAQRQIRNQEMNSTKLQDLIYQSREASQHQKQINQRLRDHVEDQEQNQEVQQMLKNLMGQVNQLKKQKQSRKVKVNVSTPQSKYEQRNDIARLMAELAS